MHPTSSCAAPAAAWTWPFRGRIPLLRPSLHTCVCQSLGVLTVVILRCSSPFVSRVATGEVNATLAAPTVLTGLYPPVQGASRWGYILSPPSA